MSTLEERKQRRIEDFLEKTWVAADAYERSFISGSAIGLVTKGVIENKPIAKAIALWQKSIWTVYYTRKAELQSGSIPFNCLDYSVCGPMPKSIPELMEEVSF